MLEESSKLIKLALKNSLMTFNPLDSQFYFVSILSFFCLQNVIFYVSEKTQKPIWAHWMELEVLGISHSILYNINNTVNTIKCYFILCRIEWDMPKTSGVIICRKLHSTIVECFRHMMTPEVLGLSHSILYNIKNIFNTIK